MRKLTFGLGGGVATSELQPAKMKAGDKGRRQNGSGGGVGEAGQPLPGE